MYDRIKNEMSNIIPKDAISCFAVHFKFMAIGTHSGKIHVMDHQGNKVHQDLLLVCDLIPAFTNLMTDFLSYPHTKTIAQHDHKPDFD